MAWILIITTVVVVWIASLCKIFNSWSSKSSSSFLGNGGDGREKNVLLVVAHPDDESMFFAPTINYLTSRGHNLHVLCLSTGNADGMGSTRKDELYQACAVLMVMCNSYKGTVRIPLHQVEVLDHPDFQDGFGKEWNHNLLANIVEKEVIKHGIDLIITFDDHGISGHCNHRDVHYGIRTFLKETSQRSIEAWELISTNILRKYSGPLDVWLSVLSCKLCRKEQAHCLLNENPRKSFCAMAQHQSQWIWFRKLFVSFSSYTYVNTLRKINI